MLLMLLLQGTPTLIKKSQSLFKEIYQAASKENTKCHSSLLPLILLLSDVT
jgi:hypothetical protein